MKMFARMAAHRAVSRGAASITVQLALFRRRRRRRPRRSAPRRAARLQHTDGLDGFAAIKILGPYPASFIAGIFLLRTSGRPARPLVRRIHTLQVRLPDAGPEIDRGTTLARTAITRPRPFEVTSRLVRSHSTSAERYFTGQSER